MSRASAPLVLFVVAAGPEMGFGHLVRASRLAKALGVRRELVLTGRDHARLAALRFGWTVHRGGDPLAALAPDLVVVDDPSVTRMSTWVTRARQAGVPVAIVTDRSRRATQADLTIDGSLATESTDTSTRVAGPAFALLDPGLAALPVSHARRRRHVLIALGGGIHVQRLGTRLARAIVAVSPGATVDIAAGFSNLVVAGRPALPPACRWVAAPNGLRTQLSQATVAVVAGGVTLHESCAAACPTVAIPVVPAQRGIIRAAVETGAVLSSATATRRRTPGTPGTSGSLHAVARAVAALLDDPIRARALGARARQVVDGRGMARVVRRLRQLAAGSTEARWRHAA